MKPPFLIGGRIKRIKRANFSPRNLRRLFERVSVIVGLIESAEIEVFDCVECLVNSQHRVFAEPFFCLIIREIPPPVTETKRVLTRWNERMSIAVLAQDSDVFQRKLPHQ